MQPTRVVSEPLSASACGPSFLRIGGEGGAGSTRQIECGARVPLLLRVREPSARLDGVTENPGHDERALWRLISASVQHFLALRRRKPVKLLLLGQPWAKSIRKWWRIMTGFQNFAAAGDDPTRESVLQSAVSAHEKHEIRLSAVGQRAT